MKNKIFLFLKGMAMGAADVVPGVSGGTIAFITGIYDTLLESIRRINPSTFQIWRQKGFAGAWAHINGSFLITLLAGIFTAIVTLAKGVTYALDNHPVIIWSFFFGLILASAIHMIKQVKTWRLLTYFAALIGAVLAYFITITNPINLEFNLFSAFLAGSIAICAMILPGISGSFILLLLGMYAPILDAVKNFDMTVLAIFGSGCIIGILLFSHVLSWLLRSHRSLTLAFLTGLIIGALGKVWPWKETMSFRVNSSSEQVPLVERVLLPNEFEAVTGEPAQLLVAITLMTFGFVLVFGLEKISKYFGD